MSSTTPVTRHWLEHAGFRAARAVWSLLPEAAADVSGRAVGSILGGVLRLRRAEVNRHVGWAFPHRDPAWRAEVVRACYRHFGREAAATLRVARWPLEELRARTRATGFEELRAAAEAGRGVVLLTAHLGNWEVGGAAVAARGVPLDVVSKGMSNPRFERDLFALRERLGMRVIEMGEASRTALRSLAQGRVVAILGDQSPRGRGVMVPFFGRPASTARGPALLAARSGAPVFVAFALREPGRRARYALDFSPLVTDPSTALEDVVEALTVGYTRMLEGAIRRAPEQYFWHHRRWKGASAEEPRSDEQVIIRRSHP
jgi:KDO2-lipid IV(A) lauroyltransferase